MRIFEMLAAQSQILAEANLSFNNVGGETSLPFTLVCGSGPVDLGGKLTVRHRALLGVVAATTDDRQKCCC